MYADVTRLTECGGYAAGKDASSVYDTAIGIVTVWHMIEWVRWTLLLTTALVDANLIPIFNVFNINVPYGFVACIIAIATRYSSAGNLCAEEGAQAERGFYLGLQVICLLVYIPTCFFHIAFMKFKGVEWLHELWLKKKEDEEEDD